MPLLLSEHDVRRVLPMPDLIQAMGSALAEYSANRVSQPVRTVIEVGPERAYFGIMPAVIDAPAAMGAKLVTVYAGNHARGLTSHLATIILLDPATGALVALLDGRYITEARTAAVSAVSVDRLARAGATRLAIIGSGVQARSHLDAIRHVRALTDVRVWSPNASHCAAFAQSASADTGLTVRAAASARTAVRDADIVVLVTASPVPVITDEDIAPGTHICAIGACRPTQREMPTALVARSRLFVDSHAAALVEAGDIVLPIKEGAFTADHIVGELGSLVLGRCAGRQSDAEVTLFKSLGMAVEDLVAAQLVAERATAAGLGTEFSLS
ncbi:MAG: ornithine cyclodeaminase family protein [Acidobacteria bacterium]|nr:ornithine cyclodeaminase family protein [Acidobacteriota bacterium]